MIKVSVIIPTYNEGDSLFRCLNSLSEQKYRDFEVIVVNDGARESISEVVDKSQNLFPEGKLTFLHQYHKGAGAARNYGATKAKGEIFVFVDADMVFEKIFLKKLIAPIISKKTIGTFSKDEFVANWNNRWSRSWNWNQNLPKKRRLPLNYPDEDNVFRAILAKEFRKVNGFTPGGYTDDWSLFEKLGTKAVHAPGARFYHENPNSLLEVFKQAKWVAKREYKFGLFGALYTLFKSNPIFSILIGLYKSIQRKEPVFIIFKVVYDVGIVSGILSYLVYKKGAK